MHLRCIPTEYTEWTVRCMQGHKTILTFNDYTSEPFEVTNSLDQGDPTSSSYYNFYSADLIEPTQDVNKLKSAFVDDTMFLVASSTFEENNTKLENMMSRPGGTAKWSKDHQSNFEIDKFTLLHMSWKLEPNPQCP